MDLNVENCHLAGESYSCQRSRVLEKFVDISCGNSFGVRIADDRGPTNKEDLILSSLRASPVYMRDSHDALR
jgi:hypothetical protein